MTRVKASPLYTLALNLQALETGKHTGLEDGLLTELLPCHSFPYHLIEELLERVCAIARCLLVAILPGLRVQHQHALRCVVPPDLAKLCRVLQAREHLGQSIEHPDDTIHDLNWHLDELGLAPQEPEQHLPLLHRGESFPRPSNWEYLVGLILVEDAVCYEGSEVLLADGFTGTELAVAEHDVGLALLDGLDLATEALEEGGGADDAVGEGGVPGRLGGELVLELELGALELE